MLTAAHIARPERNVSYPDEESVAHFAYGMKAVADQQIAGMRAFL